eukprot:evm.model.scf_354.4 EVM.evm.TU.scf_354.4   scf_354:24385-27447(-)
MPSHSGSSNGADEPKKPKKKRFYVRFAQQELKAGWKPIPTAKWSMLFFFLMAVAMLPLGIVFLFETLQVDEEIVRYDDASSEQALLDSGGEGETVTVSMVLKEDIEAPVYVYYELRDFYQNHKRYVRSRDDNQLGGKESGQGESKCEPERVLPNDAIVNPCGLLAWSYFNDTFDAAIVARDGPGTLERPLPLVISADDISWEWDRKYLYGDFETTNFNTIPEYRGGMSIDGLVSNESRFHTWMRVAATPNVRKLYGEINRDLSAGDQVNFTVLNRYNTYGFDGKKYIILSNMNWTGGRNILLGVVYMTVGGLSAMVSMIILAGELRHKRPFGDLNCVTWNRT